MSDAERLGVRKLREEGCGGCAGVDGSESMIEEGQGDTTRMGTTRARGCRLAFREQSDLVITMEFCYYLEDLASC